MRYMIYYKRTIVQCQGADSFVATFFERLIELRTNKNMSQAAVAKELGLGMRTYQYYEHGEREPQLSTLVKIADFYGVTLDYLAGRTD